MEKIRYLPWVVGALVLAALIAVRFMPLSQPPPYTPKPFVYTPEPTRAPITPAKAPAPVTPAAALESPVPIAAPALVAAGDPKWETVYQDNFETPESIKRYKLFTPSKPPGELRWFEKHKALLLKNKDDGGGEVYAAIHKSLPGDLRVRFNAMCRKGETEVSIGLMFSIDGALRNEDGYFAEFAGGLAKLKRHNVIVAQTDSPTPQTEGRWVNLEIRQVGAHIAMLMQGNQVLEWTDPQPLIGQKHDLVSFYVWDVSTIIKGLTIERNADDVIKPLNDDPAADDNLVQGARGAVEQAPPRDF